MYRRLLLACSALVGCMPFAQAVRAADLDPPVIEYQEPDSSGWYLRGDLAYTFETKGDGYYDIYGGDRYDYDSLKLKWQGDVSVGVGYQFNRHLRGDVTVGYWSRDIEGRAYLPWTDQYWTFDDESRVHAWETMANAYVDLKTFGRFTPYLGGGLGLSFLQFGTLTNNASCSGSACDADYVGHHNGLSSTRFTYALMAGTAVDLTDRFKLDVGYRFVHVNGGAAFGWDEADTAAGATGTQTWDNGFSSHQIRIGARYSFN